MLPGNLQKLVEHGIEVGQGRAVVDAPAGSGGAGQSRHIPHGVLAHAHDIAPLAMGEQLRMATRHGDTFLNRRRCRFRLPDKCGLHLGEQPRVSLGAPGDHHRVAARLRRHAHGIGTAADVAVAHDGHGHR